MRSQALALLVALALGGSAAAQPAALGQKASPELKAAREAMRSACAADRLSLCKDKAGREAMQCLRENAAKVSDPCRDAMAKLRAARGR